MPPLREPVRPARPGRATCSPSSPGRWASAIEGFTPEAREALFRYTWPGNLRELRNAMERAAIFAAGPRGRRRRPARPRSSRRREYRSRAAGSSGAVAVGEPVTLDQLEAEHIRLILARTPSREDAARILGIDPSTLYRKRKQLGL